MFIIKTHNCSSEKKLKRSATKCWKQKIYAYWMLPKKETQKTKTKHKVHRILGKVSPTRQVQQFFPLSSDRHFPISQIKQLFHVPVSISIFWGLFGRCASDVPHYLNNTRHRVWGFCKSSVITIRYGPQSSSAETYLSSQASEWEQMFKWSRRQGGKPTKSLIKHQGGPLSYILIETLWLKKELKFSFIFPISTLEFILTELMKLLSRVSSE